VQRLAPGLGLAAAIANHDDVEEPAGYLVALLA